MPLLEPVLRGIGANMGTKIVSVIIAIVLWVVVLGSRNVEVTKEIPVEVITPSELVVANDVPERVGFRLGGPKAFLRAILDRREDPIRINLVGAKAGVVTYRFFQDNIRLPIGVRVLGINPPAIVIKLEPLKRRELVVKPELRGTPPEGFRVAGVRVVPQSVKVKGPESKLDSLPEVSTVPIDLTGIRQGFDREVPLDLARQSLQLEGALPRIYVDIEPISANFRIRNVDIRVLSSYKATLSEKSVTVLVRAAPKDLKSLDRTQVFATVDLRGRPLGVYQEAVKVTLPGEIGLVKVIPDTVKVTLKP